MNEKIGYGILPERAVQLSRFDFKNWSDHPTYKDEISLIYRPEFGKSPVEKLIILSLT